MPILDVLQAWFNIRREALETLGQVTFRSQPFATDKPSLHLNIQSPSRESDLIFGVQAKPSSFWRPMGANRYRNITSFARTTIFLACCKELKPTSLTRCIGSWRAWPRQNRYSESEVMKASVTPAARSSSRTMLIMVTIIGKRIQAESNTIPTPSSRTWGSETQLGMSSSVPRN